MFDLFTFKPVSDSEVCLIYLLLNQYPTPRYVWFIYFWTSFRLRGMFDLFTFKPVSDSEVCSIYLLLNLSFFIFLVYCFLVSNLLLASSILIPPPLLCSFIFATILHFYPAFNSRIIKYVKLCQTFWQNIKNKT